MKAVVIGSSSGGPQALEILLKAIPDNLEAILIVAQHLSTQFSIQLDKNLENVVNIPVHLIQDGDCLSVSNVYIVPGDTHFFITNPNNKAYLIQSTGPQHPSIDMGFTSIAEHFGPNTIGVVLTGMGNDGVIGAKAIKQLNGYVIVQDEQSSAIYSMPKAVEEAGFADEVLPLDKIAGRIIELTKDKNN